MTVAKKMLLLVATALLGILMLAGVAQIQMNKVFTEANYSNENIIPSMQILMGIQQNIARTRIRLNRHILNTDPTQYNALEVELEKSMSDARVGFDKYEELIADNRDRELLVADEKAFATFVAIIPPILEVSRKSQLETARELLEKDRALAVAAGSTVDEHVAYNMELANAAKDRAVATKSSAAILSIFIAGITLIFIALIGFFIARNLLRQLGGEPDYAAAVVAKIAAGDLTQQVNTRQGDTTSMLAAIKEMSNSLSQVLGEVRSSADALASASEEVNATAQSLAKGASVQAASVEETSASMEEMSASIMQNNENASITDGMAQKAATDAATGGSAVASTVEAMQKIADRIGVIDDIVHDSCIQSEVGSKRTRKSSAKKCCWHN